MADKKQQQICFSLNDDEKFISFLTSAEYVGKNDYQEPSKISFLATTNTTRDTLKAYTLSYLYPFDFKDIDQAREWSVLEVDLSTFKDFDKIMTDDTIFNLVSAHLLGSLRFYSSTIGLLL